MEYIGIWLDKLIALVVVIGCFVLLLSGVDSEVKSILLLAAGWAFGGGYSEMRARRRGR